MTSWQEDLLDVLDQTRSEHEVFRKIEAAARSLGFEHCAYGLRVPLPLSNPQTILLNNYPEAWQDRYVRESYVQIDPTVHHGCRSHAPLLWTSAVFAQAQEFWEDARSFGLRFGWAKACVDGGGVRGMFTLARSADAVGEQELRENEMKMRWLAHVAHGALSRIFTTRQAELIQPNLTAREIEVLKWTADGKTSADISTLLDVSENTVNFHVKNAVFKLQTTNKTAATVRAAMLGLLG
ncbi:autoinducer binding domain-containing protein [Acidovorax sp. DW039]|uniref:autoinducer binding domain-containing protein n=1 Tax=Acidovorax sp. DW039 TaxID=3095606 RepID=UPI00308B1F2B|nr:autoinducer binding domain-containing protein [Acidovorax sp. DW039]